MRSPVDAGAAAAAAINTLAAFCGPRDVAELTVPALRGAFEVDRRVPADVVMFFGGSILSGAQVMAEALRNDVAEVSMLVGGEGHTTESLRQQAAQELGGAAVPSGPSGSSRVTEADIFDAYLRRRFGVGVDLLERESTNCGTNVTNALWMLDERGIRHDRVILIQDATMQRRMGAVLQAQAPDVRFVHFASYTAAVEAGPDGRLRYADAPADVWPLPRFASMLMGEVERLRDDEHGYGPRGRGWIAHVDVPNEVQAAYELLADAQLFSARQADPRWG